MDKHSTAVLSNFQLDFMDYYVSGLPNTNVSLSLIAFEVRCNIRVLPWTDR
jgi:hypothetical protein